MFLLLVCCCLSTDLCSCPSPAVEQQTKTLLQSKCRWVIWRWCSCWYSELQKHTARKHHMNKLNIPKLWNRLQFEKVKCYNFGKHRTEKVRGTSRCSILDLFWMLRLWHLLNNEVFSYINRLCKHLQLKRTSVDKVHITLYSGGERKSIALLYFWATLSYLVSIYHTNSL